MGLFYSFYDPTYILVLIGFLLSIAASGLVRSTFNKYSKVRNSRGISGAEAARIILANAGISDVTIRHVSGNLNDHYDPRNKTLNLSDSVYSSCSIASVGVAAHECGHAIQHNKGYIPLRFRGALVPAANLGSQLAIPMIIIGMIFSSTGFLINLGILFFAVAVMFQIVTLPVEFNASARAVNKVTELGLMGESETNGVKKVLSAAALTYVASAATAILQLLRLVILFGGKDRD